MKVILYQSVENLGLPGEIASVKPGYYRNFLGPRGIASPATPGNLKQLESRRKRLEAEASKLVNAAKAIGDRLKGVTLTFVMRAGTNDRLFGSVTSADVAEKLAEQGIEVDRRKIAVPAIKTVGTYTAKVKLHANIASPITIVVEREGGSEPEPEPIEDEAEETEKAAEGENAHAEGSAE